MRGAVIGAGAAAGLLVLGAGVWHDPDAPAPLTGARVGGGLSFVALGAALGAMIGRRHGQWVSVRVVAADR